MVITGENVFQPQAVLVVSRGQPTDRTEVKGEEGEETHLAAVAAAGDPTFAFDHSSCGGGIVQRACAAAAAAAAARSRIRGLENLHIVVAVTQGQVMGVTH